MNYFRYSLADISPYGIIGPDRYLPVDSKTGFQSGSYYYGITSIELENIPSEFSASIVSQGDVLRAMGKNWEAVIADGYTVGNITLAIDDVSLTRWTQTLVLMREAGMHDTASFAIADIDGVVHPKTVAEVRTLLVGAGSYWYQGWTANTVSGSI